MVRQYEMSWAACLAPARRKRRRRWLTAGLGDVHIVATSVTIYTYLYTYIHMIPASKLKLGETGSS